MSVFLKEQQSLVIGRLSKEKDFVVFKWGEMVLGKIPIKRMLDFYMSKCVSEDFSYWQKAFSM